MKRMILILLLVFYGCAIETEITNAEIEDLFSNLVFSDTVESEYINDSVSIDYTVCVYRLSNVGIKYTGLEFVVIKMSSPNMKVKFVNLEGNRDSIYKSFVMENSIVAVNGGYFGYNHKKTLIPLGLEVDDSVLKSSFTPWKTGGVIYDKDSTITISPISDFNRDKKRNNAIQSKPIVVYDGESEIYSKNLRLRNRTAIGIDSKDRVVVVGVFNNVTGAMSLYDFAKVLSYAKKREPIVEKALAMDGGSSSYLYLPKYNKSWGTPNLLYVPNVVLFNQ